MHEQPRESVAKIGGPQHRHIAKHFVQWLRASKARVGSGEGNGGSADSSRESRK